MKKKLRNAFVVFMVFCLFMGVMPFVGEVHAGNDKLEADTQETVQTSEDAETVSGEVQETGAVSEDAGKAEESLVVLPQESADDSAAEKQKDAPQINSGQTDAGQTGVSEGEISGEDAGTAGDSSEKKEVQIADIMKSEQASQKVSKALKKEGTSSNGLTTSDWHIYLGRRDASGNYGEELSGSTTVKKGDDITIHMKWAIDNRDKDTNTFTIDLSTQNITLINNSNYKITDDTGKQTGSFSVSGNQLTVTLTDEYLNSGSSKDGWLEIQAKIANDISDDLHNTNIPVQIENKTYNVPFNANISDGQATIDKWKTGSVYSENGKLYQKYSAVLNVSGKGVHDVVLSELPGTGLSNPTNVRIDSGNTTVKGLASSYTTFAAFAAAVKAAGTSASPLTSGSKITFEYVMEVDSSIADGSSTKNYDNEIDADYQDSANKPQHSSDKEWGVSFLSPSVQKTGVWADAAHTRIKWTITVKPGSMAAGSAGAALPFGNVKDTPVKIDGQSWNTDYTGDAFQSTQGDSYILNPQKFTAKQEYDGTTSYTAEFVTGVDEAFLNKTSSIKLENTVSAEMGGKTYTSGKVGVATDGKQWIDKEAVSYDADTKTITWKATLGNIPNKVSDVSVTDRTTGGNHNLLNTVSVKSLKTGTVTNVVTDGVSNTNAAATWASGVLTFTKAYIDANVGGKIEITYQTKVTDATLNGKKYLNTVTLNYKEDGLTGTQTWEDTAEYEEQNALTKSGEVHKRESWDNSTPSDRVDYTVRIDLKKVSEMAGTSIAAGKKIVLTDTLPEGMELVKGSVAASNNFSVSSAVSANGKTLTLTLPITAANVSAAGGSVDVTYSLHLKDTKKFIADGKNVTVTNKVSGVYDGKNIGEFAVDNELVPGKFASKTALYDVTTAPNVEYQVEINKNAMNLSDNAANTIEVEDILGKNSDLTYNLDSVRVEQKNPGEWDWKPLPDSKWSCVPDLVNNKLVFTLPDETYLRISYSAFVGLEKGADIVPERATNQVKVSGFKEEFAGDKKQIAGTAMQGAGGSNKETPTIKLYKYYVDENGKTCPLSDCVFHLAEMEYDAAAGKIIQPSDGEVVKNIVTKNGYATVEFTHLDRVYALYEDAAPDGFDVNDKPYYFAVSKGNTAPDVPSGTECKLLHNNGIINYENAVSKTAKFGNIQIKKTISGDVTEEEIAKSLLTFTVKNNKTNKVQTYTLKDDFKPDASGKVWTKVLSGMAVGTYTVTETLRDIDGYVLESVTYSLDGGNTFTNGAQAQVGVTAGKTTSVNYVDEYTKLVGGGKLIITKTIRGGVTKEEAEGALKFTVTNNDTKKSTEYTLKDFQYDKTTGVYTLTLNRNAGGYTVTESVTDIKGYTLTNVNYTVNGGSKTNGKSVTVTVEKDAKTTVAYEDVYVEKSSVGTLYITKRVKGGVSREKAENALKFRVAADGANEGVTYSLGDFSYNKKTETYTLKLSLAAGDYTVKETASDIKGYKLSKVTCAVGNGEQKKGKTVSVKVKKNKKTTAAYEDSYKKKASGKKKPVEPSDSKGGAKPKSKTGGLAKTGDAGNSLTWFIVMFVSMIGALVCMMDASRKTEPVRRTKTGQKPECARRAKTGRRKRR